MAERYSDRSGQPRSVTARMAAWACFGVLVAIIALFAFRSDRARGAGPLVVVEDASTLGAGAFSGSVCFQVTRDGDGTVISENCVDAPANFAAPDGLEIGVPYSISISLSDPNCQLLDDSRVSDGSVPFAVRVSCDPAFLTATAAAQPTSTPTPLPTDTPTPLPTPTSTSSPVPSPTPEPTDTPEQEPTPTLVPTSDIPPTEEAETATPSVQPTPSAEADSEGEIGSDVQSPEIIAPQVVDIQLIELTGMEGAQRVRGTVTVSYQIPPISNATVSVLLSIGSLGGGNATIVPSDISLVGVGAPAPINDGTSIGSCVPLGESALPMPLDAAVPVVACQSTEDGGGQFRQVLTIEFAASSVASLDAYAGSIFLTTAIAP